VGKAGGRGRGAGVREQGSGVRGRESLTASGSTAKLRFARTGEAPVPTQARPHTGSSLHGPVPIQGRPHIGFGGYILLALELLLWI
jgi:hypothetical protein